MEFTINTSKKYEVIDINQKVKDLVKKSGVDEGFCNIFTKHTTTAIIINENEDSNIGVDLVVALDKLIPEGVWLHDKVDDNGAAHLKSAILGPSETVHIKESELILGTWQSLMLVELDGPRKRTVRIEVLKK